MKKQYIEELYLQAMTEGRIAEERLFEALSARFRLIVGNKIWDRQDAYEVAQDALMTVFAKYKTSAFKSTFSVWAHKILHHKMLHYFRTKSRQNQRMISKENPEPNSSGWHPDPMLESNMVTCIRKIIAQKPHYARALILMYQGYTADDICEKLKLGKSNLYSILSRARSLLKYCLETGDIK